MTKATRKRGGERMKIGVDFGTTYTKVVYRDPTDTMRAFEYPPGDTGSRFVPTAVAYRRNGKKLDLAGIGQAARRLALDEDDILLYQNFKMMLPLPEKAWAAHGWADDAKSPADVTADFFRALLVDGEGAFGREASRSIEAIVMSVPEVWHRRLDTPGVIQLRSVVCDRLGLPLSHLQSEPVCAAAALVYERNRQRRPYQGNLLVCDVGGGTFDVALCEVSGNKISVIDFDGNGQEGLGTSGVMFDQAITKAAFQSVHKREPALDDPDYVGLLHAFEQTKIQNSNQIQDLLRMSRSQQMPDMSIYKVLKQYRITRQQFDDAFAPIELGMSEVLGRIRSRAAARGTAIENLMVVGGFGQFAPVRAAIAAALAGGAGGRDAAVVRDTERDHLAIAQGAALIANGLIETEERYPHSIGILATFLRDGTYKPGIVPIIEANKVPIKAQGSLRSWAEQDGKPVATELQRSGKVALPLRAKTLGKGDWKRMDVAPQDLPPTGTYHIGVDIDRSQILTLVFRLASGGKEYLYPVGQFTLDLIVPGTDSAS